MTLHDALTFNDHFRRARAVSGSGLVFRIVRRIGGAKAMSPKQLEWLCSRRIWKDSSELSVLGGSWLVSGDLHAVERTLADVGARGRVVIGFPLTGLAGTSLGPRQVSMGFHCRPEFYASS